MLLGVGYATWGLLVASGAAFGWYVDNVANTGNQKIQDIQDSFFDSIDYRTWILLGFSVYLWTEKDTKKSVSIRRGSKISEARKFYSASRF